MVRYFIFITLLILAVACTPAEPEAVPVETIRPSATSTPFPPPGLVQVEEQPTATPIVRVTGTPWSAPPVSPQDSFWYLDDNKVMRYNMSSGSTETVLETDSGDIETARLSPYGEQWLAFVDKEGLKLKSLGEGAIQLISESIGEWPARGLVFSPDGRFLAYTDITALHILDLATKNDVLVWENEYEYREQDSPNITVYSADSWSADQEWLTLSIAKWEGGWIEVGSLETGNHFPILGCSYTAWSPLETRLAMAVRYNGYLGCDGDFDGLYTVDPSLTGIEEQKIYAESLPEANLGMIGVGEVSWSPDGAQILFVQEDNELSEAKAEKDWLYFPGQTQSSPPANILLASPDTVDHRDGAGRIVLRLDGSATVIPERDYQRQLRLQGAIP
jgi:hypothetical protein